MNKSRIIHIGSVLIAVVFCLCAPLQADAFETRAKAAFITDFETGTVLFEKDADVPLPPASMSKLMTVYMAFEALRDGRLRLEDRLPVSQHAMGYTGSTMFLDTTDRVTVEDLLRGIIILSGNDASAVIAEALSPDGTEAGFARLMTRRAQELGMTNAHFANSNGWPQAGHVMSVRDLGILADRIIRDFPEYYGLFAETRFEFDGRAPQNVRNRNPLLGLGIGADGLKTGHTNEAGYGLVGSARRDGRRVIVVLTGLPSEAARANEAETLITWAFRNFTKDTIAKDGQVFGHATVWMGAQQHVALRSPAQIEIIRSAQQSGPLAARIEYQGPIEAPIQKDAPIAQLIVSPEGLAEQRFDLVADTDVPRGGFLTRLITSAQKLLIDFDVMAKEDL